MKTRTNRYLPSDSIGNEEMLFWILMWIYTARPDPVSTWPSNNVNPQPCGSQIQLWGHWVWRDPTRSDNSTHVFNAAESQKQRKQEQTTLLYLLCNTMIMCSLSVGVHKCSRMPLNVGLCVCVCVCVPSGFLGQLDQMGDMNVWGYCSTRDSIVISFVYTKSCYTAKDVSSQLRKH